MQLYNEDLIDLFDCNRDAVRPKPVTVQELHVNSPLSFFLPLVEEAAYP